jgi:hypothetical protein
METRASRFISAEQLPIMQGDSIVLDVTGDSLLDYNGSLEIKAVGTIKPTAVATGRTVVPQRLSIAQLCSNLSTIECTLVKISRRLQQVAPLTPATEH